VLSGKDKFTKGENSFLKANKANCFDKTNPSNVVKLFEVMKQAACIQPDAKLKLKYAELLETCSDQLLGPDQFIRLFTLIKHIENTEKLTNTEDMLNPIRKLIERMFIVMSEKGIIPESIIKNKGWLNGSSIFLANKHSDYVHLSEITPTLISENIHRLLNIIQDASHSEGELKLKVDQYLKNSQSDFLYRSSVFLLFDLLLWFKLFMEKNNIRDTNLKLWESKVINGDWIVGTITRIANNGWGTFQPENANATIGIPPKMITEHHLNETDSIKIIAETSSDGTKIHIKAISK
jgi:hypothetical protein